MGVAMIRRTIAGAVAALALVACGTPHHQQERVAPKVESRMAAAASATSEAGASRIVFHGKSVGAPGGPMKMDGFGLVDPRVDRGRLVMRLGQSELLGDLGTMEVVGDGLTMYIKWPFLSSKLPAGKPWVTMDLEAIGKDMGVDMNAFMQLGGQSVGDSVRYLWGATDVTTVGHPKVNGVATTHYRAVVDLELVKTQAPADIRESIGESIDRLIELTGMSEVPTEVWIDDSNLVRRQKMTMDLTNADPSLGMPPMTTTQSTDYIKYGVKATVHVPSPDKTTDLMELIGESGGGTSF